MAPSHPAPGIPVRVAEDTVGFLAGYLKPPYLKPGAAGGTWGWPFNQGLGEQAVQAELAPQSEGVVP